MNILLIGSGGREHALAYALKKSESTEKLYCSPGNPGIFSLAENAGINTSDFESTADFCKNNNIDLVVVGPEQPLADGIVDYFEKAGILAFGPTQKAAMLESSKGFAKDFMLRHNIPTAPYMVFAENEKDKATKYLEKSDYPIVLKADGLAAGKGVIIANNIEEASGALESMFGGAFSGAGKTVVIEGFLKGEEASILALCDGKDYITLAPSQDHKRAFDGDKGKNTGGMGAYAPAPIVGDALMQKVNDRILTPAINGMAAEGTPFKGCLYAGLMIDKGEPYVVEFNVRFGDPETQPVLSVFEGDLAKLLYSAAAGKLDRTSIKNVCARNACCVVLASAGYPDSFEKGFPISGIENAEKVGALAFHAGTALKDGLLVNSGGRVLGVCGLGESLKEAIDKSYSALKKIRFDNMFYRKDIGKKALVK